MHELYLQIYPFVEISQQLDPLYERSMSEHIKLIEAILDENVEEALKILEVHIENCKNDGFKILQDGLYLQGVNHK